MIRARSCACVRDHNPEPQSLDQHHIWPLGMGGPDTPGNLITVCPSTHRNVHEVLRAMVAFGGPKLVPDVIAEHFTGYAWTLASEGYWKWRGP